MQSLRSCGMAELRRHGKWGEFRWLVCGFMWIMCEWVWIPVNSCECLWIPVNSCEFLWMMCGFMRAISHWVGGIRHERLRWNVAVSGDDRWGLWGTPWNVCWQRPPIAVSVTNRHSPRTPAKYCSIDNHNRSLVMSLNRQPPLTYFSVLLSIYI